jgi:hypothetical protein
MSRNREQEACRALRLVTERKTRNTAGESASSEHPARRPGKDRTLRTRTADVRSRSRQARRGTVLATVHPKPPYPYDMKERSFRARRRASPSPGRSFGRAEQVLSRPSFWSAARARRTATRTSRIMARFSSSPTRWSAGTLRSFVTTTAASANRAGIRAGDNRRLCARCERRGPLLDDPDRRRDLCDRQVPTLIADFVDGTAVTFGMEGQVATSTDSLHDR